MKTHSCNSTNTLHLYTHTLLLVHSINTDIIRTSTEGNAEIPQIRNISQNNSNVLSGDRLKTQEIHKKERPDLQKSHVGDKFTVKHRQPDKTRLIYLFVLLQEKCIVEALFLFLSKGLLWYQIASLSIAIEYGSIHIRFALLIPSLCQPQASLEKL